MFGRIGPAAMAAAAALNCAAYAQTEQGEAEIQVFEPAYFEKFGPRTALDMLNQVPGFSVRDNSAGRGLGQGGTNVLINGERITAKDTGPLDVLARTPVNNVVRIEVTDAASLGVTGLTGQVANVVTERTGISGSWEYRPLFRENFQPRFSSGAASLSGEAGPISYTVGFENDSFRRGARGPEEVLDASGAILATRIEDRQDYGENPGATFAISAGSADGTLLSLTGGANLFTFDGRELSWREGGELRDSRNAEDEWNAEISGEFSRPVGPGRAKTIAYYRFEHSPTINRLWLNRDAELVGVSTFGQTADETEAIGRLEYTIRRPDNRAWELAAEYAYNSLESDSYFETDESGFPERTILEPVLVEENRIQGSLTYSASLFENLALQASAGAEYSELERSTENAPAEKPRSFSRPRGFVSLAYPFGGKTDLRARVERSVGQLNFYDFVDSQNLTEEREVAGNSALVPQQSWDGEIEIERRFAPGEKVILRTAASLIEDRVDRIVIEGADAVGNIEEARQLSLGLEGTMLFDRFGIEGGRLDFQFDRRFTELEDPLTGEDRPFSDIEDLNGELEFRHDIVNTNFAYGFFLGTFRLTPLLRAQERSLFEIGAPNAEVFVQHKDVLGANLLVAVSNPFDQEERFERVFYAGLRDEGEVDFIERRARTYGPILSVSLSGTF